MDKKYPLNFAETFALIGAAGTLYGFLREFDIARNTSLYISIAVLCITGLILCILRIWQAIKGSDKWKLKIIPLTSGDDALLDVLGTKESIVTTHFTEDHPTTAYVDLMIRKLEQGVWITRYLPENFDKCTDNNKWIKDFSNYSNYVEKNVDGHQLPFDVTIFDSSKVVLSFATNKDIRRFNKAIVMSNKDAVDCFKTSLEKLEITDNEIS